MARYRFFVVAGLAGMSAAPLAMAAEKAPAPSARRAERFAVSAPLGEIAGAPVAAAVNGGRPADVEVPLGDLPATVRRIPGPMTAATTAQPASVSALVLPMPPPAIAFDGLSNEDNLNVFGSRVTPPDTNGDVGPNHYVQMTNVLVRVFSKTGTPLTAPFKLSSLFASVGGGCATRDDGDPIVVYDPLADRWLLSQFCRLADPTPHQMIAISQTPDPTGAYFVYDFRMPNAKLNDYPKIGVWPDAYYMTDNQFVDSTFAGGGVFAFDRARMLAGDPTAGFIYFDLAANKGGMLPADLDGFAPPPAGTPGYFAQFQSSVFGEGIDGLRIFEFRADFANPAASTFTLRADSPVPVAAFDPRSPIGRTDIEQPAPGLLLDSIPDRLMHRLAYRNFATHESMVVTHTVNVGTGITAETHQAGVRYYELRRTLPGGTFTVHEQGTHAPDSDNRWMASAAQDAQGNIAVGYSVSSATTMPSIRYSGRLAGDPPGALLGEWALFEGTGVQTGSNRWGDYSAMSVDPADDCTFWYTTEYYTASSPSGWLTGIGSFKFPTCAGVPFRGTVNGTVTDAATGLPVQGATISLGGSASATTDAAGRYSIQRSPGTYDMAVSRPSYRPAARPGVVVTDGATIDADFVLTPRVPTRIMPQAVGGQTGIAGLPLPIGPVVIVLDDEGQPVAGVSVTFAVTAGAGSIVGSATQTTNLRGIASVGWQLGGAAGPNELTATAAVVLAGNPVTFAASAVVLNASIGDVTLNEGNSGSTNATFTVSLSSPVPAGQAAALTVATAEGTATLNAFPFGNPAPITIPALGNATPYPSGITVPALARPPRKVTVTLTNFSHDFLSDVDVLLVGPGGQGVVLMSDVGGGSSVINRTLTFDDAGPALGSTPLVSGLFRPTNLAIGPADAFPAPAPAGPYSAGLSVFNGLDAAGHWQLFVLDDEAGITGSIAGGWSLTFYLGDFAPAGEVLTFGPGMSTRSLAVSVFGDVELEADETFFVNLSAPVNLTIGDPQAMGTIVNDDVATVPPVSIDSISVVEGNTGTTNATFTVTLLRPSTATVTVDYATSNSSATAGSDYIAATGTATFPPGSTRQTLTVSVIGDLVNEANETFFVSLSNPVNATIGTGFGQCTILNDDVAAVSGLITDAATGLPLGAVSVSLFNAGGTSVGSVTTGPSGMWTIGNLSGGTYFARTSNGLGYVDELYNDIPCTPCATTSGTPITLVGGTTTTGINFALARGGRIAGRLTNAATGAPLVGAFAQIYNAAGTLIMSRPTDSAGNYLSLGLPTGSYRVRSSNSLGFVDELYDDIVCFSCNPSTGVPVAVTAGATTSGIDFALTPGGRVSGTITDAGTGGPVGGVTVLFFDANGALVLSATSSSATGVYTTSGLPAGTYFARTFNGAGYLNELYDDMPCPFECPVASGTPIVVTLGATTGGINFDLVRGGRISGTFTDSATGTPIATGVVDVYSSTGTFLTASSAASGTYTTAGLPTGTYLVRSRNNVGYVDEAFDNVPCAPCAITDATPVSVTLGATTAGIHFALDRGARVSGTVRSATGAPLSSITVQVRSPSGSILASGTTNSAGTYTSGTGLPTGSYRVRTSNAQGLVDEAYDDVTCVGCAADTGSAVAATAPSTTTGIDFVLVPGGRIAGRVTDETTGAPVAGVTVRFFNAAGDPATTATTDAAGNYLSRAGLTTGSYFARTLNTAGYTDELYDGVVCLACDVTFGTPIAVTSPDTRGGVDFTLFRGPAVSISDATAAEGGSATFTVTLSAPTTGTVTVDVDTADGTAAAGTDYTATSATVTFAPGTTSQTFTVPVNGDALDEADESVLVLLSNAGHAKIADGQGTGTIADDDDPPRISVGGGGNVTEGDTGTTDAVFIVSLSAASGQTVTATVFTLSGCTATPGTDFEAVTDHLVTFPPGTLSQTVAVHVVGDTLDEDDECFDLAINTVNNATVDAGESMATIVDDDAMPTISILGTTTPTTTRVTEGNTGATDALFTVSLSAPSGKTVTAPVFTLDGNSTPGVDFMPLVDHVLTFAPGTTSQTVAVTVLGDTVSETDEIFDAVLGNVTNATVGQGEAMGIIADDEPPLISMSIAQPNVTEGHAGTTPTVFTVSLSKPSTQTVTATVFTLSGCTATPGADFVPVVDQLVTFPPGTTSQTVTVSVIGDSVDEADECFDLAINTVSNATVDAGEAMAMIIDDDSAPLPAVSILGTSTPTTTVVTEGNSGTVGAAFTVRLSAPSAQTVTVTVFTLDGTSTPGADFVPLVDHLVTFPPGTTTQTVTVSVIGDTLLEGDHFFDAVLSDVTNATVDQGEAMGIIVDDDTAALAPAADAYVRNGVYSLTNFGTATRLQVRQSPAAGSSRRSFLRFDLTGVDSQRIGRATLKVFVDDVDGRRSRFKVFGVSDDSWRETRIHWINQPPTGAALASATVTGSGWVTLDVTDFVNAQLAPGGDKLVSLALRDDTLANALVSLHSREAQAKKPVLVLGP